MCLFRLNIPRVLFFLICFSTFHSVKAIQQDSISLKLQKASELVNSQPALAEIQLREVLKASEEAKEYITWCEAAKRLAILQINSGRFAPASIELQRYIQVSEQYNLLLYNAHFKYLLGNASHAQGRLSQAVENYLLALRYFEANQVESGLLNTYTSLADVYSRQNNFSKAIEYNLKAIKLFEQRKDRFRLLSTYEQVGLWYARQGQVQKAQESYNKALNLYKEIGNKAGISATYINMGDLSFELKEFKTAIVQYEKAHTISSQLKIAPLQCRSLLGLAKAHAMEKDYESAAKEYRKASLLAKETGMKIELEEAYEGLAELYRSLNDKQTSKAYQSLSNEIKDSIFNDSILRATSDLQLRYESDKKQVELEVVKKEDEIKSMQLKQANQVKNFFVALSVLLVALVFLFVYFISENRKINKQLKRGLTELEIKNQEILLQQEQLTQLNQVKDRFFSIISHDLRNNLTTMKLYFDLVSNPAYDSSSQQEFGKEVAASVQNTIDLLENLLVWASGQIKGVRVEPKKVNLYHLAEENIGMLKSMAMQKNILLHNETDQDACLYADPNMVNLILRNLLSNALKFTREGGEVSILSEEFDTYHQISVIDNGVGIDASKLETLFIAHANVSTQGTANEKGTGLGLMLCKEFTEKNGGKIWVESESGKGSSFMLTFPKYQ